MTRRAVRTIEASRTTARPRSRSARRKTSFKHRLKTAFAIALLAVETVIALALALALVVFWRFSAILPNVDDLSGDLRPAVATTIWSDDGVQLGKLDTVNRDPVTYDEVPPDLLHATISIEDHRFYEHKGVDVQGIARAVRANASEGSVSRQGGSTITQQLVRNIDRFGLTKEKRYSRKVREALTALRLEQLYSKNEILMLYLNNIYYGGGAYGIQAASKTYFGKSAYKLTLSEAALLAGLPQRPSAFTPFEHRARAVKRRDEVLDSMEKYGYIQPDACAAAKAETLRLMPQQKHKDNNFKAPYFVQYVLNDLTRRYGTDYVQSGLKIETTLNWKIQQAAEEELEQGLKNSSDVGCNQGALISLDQKTGYIRAMVGGRSFRAGQFNNITQGRRQPGSTFKIFDYSAAFDLGKCEIDSTFPDKPIPYPNDKTKIVHNYGGGYSYREIDCLTAIKFSKNTIAVQVAQQASIEKVIEYAHKMGITSHLEPVLPTALGASEVRPLDLCSAYTVFPMLGKRCLPMGVVRVTDREGNIVEERTPQMESDILKTHTVEQMERGLEAVVNGGSGTAARERNGTVVENAHGKTGTTSDSKDAWFAGYSPELTTVIWVASVHHFRPSGAATYTSMGQATGGVVCAPIWHDFMMRAIPEQRKFLAPGQVAPQQTPPTIDETNQHTGTKKISDVKKPVDGAPVMAPVPDPTLDGGTDDPQNPDGSGALPPVDGQPEQNTAPPIAGGDPNTVQPRDPNVNGGTAPPPASGSDPARPERTVQPQETTAPPPVRIAQPPRTVRPVHIEEEMADVTVCVDSGQRATQWCGATKTSRMTKRAAARLKRCRLHHAPAGEPDQ